MTCGPDFRDSSWGRAHVTMATLCSYLLLALAAVVRGDFRAKFEVELSSGIKEFTVLVHKDWAPIGAARFKALVEDKFYDDTRFFRVIPGFMVQFGISGDPAVSANWRSSTISDEPVKASNKPGFTAWSKCPALQQPVRPRRSQGPAACSGLPSSRGAPSPFGC